MRCGCDSRFLQLLVDLRSVVRDQLDDAGDELGRLAGAGGSFDDEGVVEGLSDQGPILRVVEYAISD